MATVYLADDIKHFGWGLTSVGEYHFRERSTPSKTGTKSSATASRTKPLTHRQ